MNRLGGDGIPGPGAVPQGGANPGKLKIPYPASCYGRHTFMIMLHP